MNEHGVKKLVKAAMDGVPQIKGAYANKHGGRCALGVLGWDDKTKTMGAGWRRCGLDDWWVLACPHGCGIEADEIAMIQHLNDDHGDDFLTIARKLGPDS